MTTSAEQFAKEQGYVLSYLNPRILEFAEAYAATLRQQLAVAERWKDDWFTKLSAIEKRAETAEAALLSAQKEIERLKRELSWAHKPTT